MRIGTVLLLAGIATIIGVAGTQVLLPPHPAQVDLEFPMTVSSPETKFVATVRTNARDLGAFSDQQLVQVGRGICTSLDRMAELSSLSSTDVSAHDLQVLMAAAVDTLCPSHRDLIGPSLRSGS
ncbi:MAG: hypothetical protein JWL97_4461 [Gemmatimonadales bacterium]|jgi:hypothetical protein|nr:hypothetical protein [Gemmatimonadales bacterium]